jgi:peptidoglycan/LPS O-acetylase OafA/YrhL/2-polyprenyl-3-methyl-5-hydroxy-6-metoxy-1,4-benzoquinol methylase
MNGGGTSTVSPPVSDRANDLRTILAGDNLPTLHGYRAVGVLFVTAYHFGYAIPGSLALTGFFVLSGLLITWLLRKEQHATGKVSVRRFYLRRALRILPAYYVYIILSLALMAFLGKSMPDGMVASTFFYVTNYYNAFHDHPSGPYSHLWSLGVEEQFYLLWPIMLVFFARRGWGALAKSLVVAIALVFVWRSVMYLSTGNIAYGYNAFDTRFDSLAIGCLLAVCVERDRFRRFVAVMTRWTWLPLLTLALLTVLRQGPEAYLYTAGFTIESLLFAVLLIQLVTLHRSRLWKWLEHPKVRYIGLISYPMYLYHQWAIGVGQKLTFLPDVAQFGIAALITVAAGAVSYHAIERPFLALKKRFEHGSRPEKRATLREAFVARGLQHSQRSRTDLSTALPPAALRLPVSDQLPTEQAMELQGGQRFAFGENWDRFLRVLDDQRIAAAERSLREMLGAETIRGRSFLDVGSGSGLFSLAARRLGARVHSFDYDAASVACTAALKQRFCPNDADWTVEQGSVLDRRYLESLGTFDVVYAWGVLHHTGAMWQALQNVAAAVAPGGRLFVALYNDQGNWSSRWRRVKRFYCSGPLGRAVVCATFIPAFAFRDFAADLVWMRNPVRRYSEYKRNRGMSVVHDWIDWLGGYPFEVAKPEQVFDFFREGGLHLLKLKTCGGTVGCNEFVFQRETSADHSAFPERLAESPTSRIAS